MTKEEGSKEFEQDMMGMLEEDINDRWKLVERALVLTASLETTKTWNGTYHRKFYPVDDEILAAIDASRRACEAIGLDFKREAM